MSKTSLPQRTQVLQLLDERSPRALHAREIAAALQVRDGDYLALLSLLETLRLDGAIRGLRGQRFGSVRKDRNREVREGRLRMHPRGFGFVSSAGIADDVYVHGEAVGSAMHGDTVRVQVMTRSMRGLEGRIVEVLQRANHRVQGVLRKTAHGAWLEVDDARVRGPIVLRGDVNGENGDAAVVQIVRFPESEHEHPEAILVAALGPPGSPDVETRKILLRQGIEESFPQTVWQNLEHLASPWDDSLVGAREDLRDVPFVTIDPIDARDRDDAIWVRELEDGFEAWVAIADVSEYVQPGSALDEEAKIRSFSVYLPDRAVPMLPPTLSSFLCSLEQGLDRLCVALWMKFDSRGRRTHSRLCEGVMRSRATLNYHQVASAMGWSNACAEGLNSEVACMMEQADELARLLRRRRMRRGALELTAPEPEIHLDPDSGYPVDVVRHAEDPGVKRAYRLIEELMVASNEAVAQWLQDLQEQVIYRVHPPPSEARLLRLAQLCFSLDIPFEYEDAADPKRLGAFLRDVQDHPLAGIIGILTLRSLTPASYDTVNVGHYGLASHAYAHFTSPIRRYPDLVNHRIVKARLRADRFQATDWHDIAMHCTRREREVVDVEREVFDVYRCVLMRDRIGERYSGIVTDVGMNAVTVTLDQPFVEILIPEEGLGSGGYQRSEDGLHWVVRRSGDRISLGTRLEVEVVSTDLTRRVIIGKRIFNTKTFKKLSTTPISSRKNVREYRKRRKYNDKSNR